MPVPGLSFVAVDVETATSFRHSICQIALVKVVGGTVVDSYATLIKPEPNEFNWHNTRVHGITARDVARSPKWAEVWPDINDFISGHTLVAHNASFDKSAVLRTHEHAGFAPLALDFVCTVLASRRLLSLPDNKLPTVANYLGLDAFKHHDAFDDAKACAEIAMTLVEKFGFEDINGLR